MEVVGAVGAGGFNSDASPLSTKNLSEEAWCVERRMGEALDMVVALVRVVNGSMRTETID